MRYANLKFAWCRPQVLLESSAMWKGELAWRAVCVRSELRCIRGEGPRRQLGSTRTEELARLVGRRVSGIRILRIALGKFYGQATKSVRWMPWRQQTTKDVASCEKPRGAASRL